HNTRYSTRYVFVDPACLILHRLLSFAFRCSGHHLHLHSFPTRRSSDLAAEPQRDGRMVAITANDLGGVAQKQRVIHRLHVVVLRSEEHTSELQSRFDLVCRLLLEKKKKKIIIETSIKN